jgi:AraC-like DNA-binding protein
LYLIPNAIYIVAVILAVATLIALMKEKYYLRAPSINHLMVYLFCMAISNFFVILVSSQTILLVPHLFKISMPLSFVTPVSGYLYIKYSLEQKNSRFSGIWPHYILALIVTLHYFPFAFSSTEYKLDILNKVMEIPESIVSIKFGWIFSENQVILIRSFQTVIYLAFSYKIIYHFNSKLAHNNLVEKSQKHYRWIKFFFWCQFSYFVLLHFLYFIFINQFNGIENYLYLEKIAFISTSVIVLLMSSYLIINPKLLLIAGEPIRLKNQKRPLNMDYQHVIQEIREKELFMDQTINQPRLADSLNFSSGELSTIIKLAGFENFNQFLNHIRLEVFLSKASSGQLKVNSIEGIANSSGFKSPSTFYRVFNEKYGVSPKKYLDILQNNKDVETP